MKTINILEFKTRNNNRYILDGITGTVLAVDDLIMDCIYEVANDKDINEIKSSLLKKYEDKNNVNAALTFIYSFYKEKGAFFINKKNEIKKRNNSQQFDSNLIRDIFNAGHIQQLILNVTEDCNLRCKYCYLSESYDYTRNRTERKMQFATAKTAMDKFFERIENIKLFNPGKKCGITFYGGEPLLNFQLIYDSIEYAKKNCPVTPIFNMTTNGTLLKDEILDYLIDNNVSISISLDGDKENHDRNRVFDDGNGSFHAVITNINEINNKYPKYDKINISSVYDFKTDLKKNSLFFAENKLPHIGFINQVTSLNTDYFSSFSKDDMQNFIKAYFELMNEYIDCKIKGEKLSPYLQMLSELSIFSVLFRTRVADEKLPIMPYTSSCVPGMKISVRVDETYDMCERINSTFPIGDNENGCDINKIANIINEYNSFVTKDCPECPLNRQCGMCFALCCKDGVFEKPNCHDIINAYTLNLGIAYSVLEENPNGFDELKILDQWVFNS
ncbi:MAG: radical SAM protein [Lachnospiraceae bacterium]|nr:radical SAM protein [Lachnospiraceae bacterium]